MVSLYASYIKFSTKYDLYIHIEKDLPNQLWSRYIATNDGGMVK